MAALAAFLPIAAILALMLGARWAAGPAGLAGLAIALPVAVLGFGWRGPEAAGGLAPALIGVGAEAGFKALTILLIVVPALWLHEVQLGSGATETLRLALARLSDDPRIAALPISWFFALFAEGAAGFGTPVALAAPLLVAVGFAPVEAVSLALIGHAVGVSFGAVGTPVLPQLAATSGLAPRDLAGVTAGLHAALGWTMALFAMLALARLMVHAGLVQALADGAAGLVGPLWPLLAPAAGGLGTFVTGSATASNILLSDFQRATAEAIGLPLLPVMAAQGVGAAIGNIICPHNIDAGAATVGLGGRETARVLRLTMPAALLYTALAGGLVFALIAAGTMR